MADNEKLDNQRLKNFKNKGRDLEVKVETRSVSRLRGQPFASSFPCDVVSNFHHHRRLYTHNIIHSLYLYLVFLFGFPP